MINNFGNHAEMIPILIDFLCVLPEELLYNTKIRLEVVLIDDRKPSLKLESKRYSQTMQILCFKLFFESSKALAEEMLK